MENAKQQLVERLKTANNILVTVSRDPSVDQLAALLGLTLMLNKQGKHAAAVFSGETPSTLEFLQPEETFEKNTDSLRDFIIALDKAKADKLRYKVEDDVVRIFITPYKTSISQDDFDFSQGDFNVDVVIALGVKSQEDIDEAIVAHGRILHDATVASVNVTPDSNLGSINWTDTSSSSLSELITGLASDLEGLALDEQISNALLTGIVAETHRFSNDKTSAQTMSVAAILMAAGANQQLVASKLETPKIAADGEEHELPEDEADDEPEEDKKASNDGSLEIEHGKDESDDESEDTSDAPDEEVPSDDEPAIELPEPDENAEPELPEADDEPKNSNDSESEFTKGSKLLIEPPVLGGTLTANTHEESLDPSTDPLSLVGEEKPKLFDRQPNTLPSDPPAADEAPAEQPSAGPTAPPQPAAFTPPPPAWMPPAAPAAATTDDDSQDGSTLSDIEAAVQDSTPTDAPASAPEPEVEDLDTARDQVMKALSSSDAASDAPQPPIQALGAQPIDLNPEPAHAPAPAPADVPAPTQPVTSNAKVNDPTAPPPVPPPIPFQFGNPPTSN